MRERLFAHVRVLVSTCESACAEYVRACACACAYVQDIQSFSELGR